MFKYFYEFLVLAGKSDLKEGAQEPQRVFQSKDVTELQKMWKQTNGCKYSEPETRKY